MLDILFWQWFYLCFIWFLNDPLLLSMEPLKPSPKGRSWVSFWCLCMNLQMIQKLYYSLSSCNAEGLVICSFVCSHCWWYDLRELIICLWRIWIQGPVSSRPWRLSQSFYKYLFSHAFPMHNIIRIICFLNMIIKGGISLPIPF